MKMDMECKCCKMCMLPFTSFRRRQWVPLSQCDV